jgi:hypothetical protein
MCSAGLYHRHMGLNPFRKQRTSTLDLLLVAGFVLLTLALVAWGFFG